MKDALDRVIELVKDDKELHDAVVRLINSMAADKEYRTEHAKNKEELRAKRIASARRRGRRAQIDTMVKS